MAPFRILKVALDTPLDFLFDYSWTVEEGSPEPQVGHFAVVPFGRREITGLIIGIAATSDLAPEKLKSGSVRRRAASAALIGLWRSITSQPSCRRLTSHAL